MSEQLRDLHAEALYRALREGYTLTPLTKRWPAISIEDAYHISRRILERRVADGQAIVGKKIGVTSRVVQQMLGVHQPDFGFLTQDMWFANGEVISLRDNRLIQPRAEGEIAFKLKRDLIGPDVTELDVLEATECVMACFERRPDSVASTSARRKRSPSRRSSTPERCQRHKASSPKRSGGSG